MSNCPEPGSVQVAAWYNNLAAACPWDNDAAFEYGALIGSEFRNEGYNMSLGVSESRARAAERRTFEYLGEDPLLTHVPRIAQALERTDSSVVAIEASPDNRPAE